MRHQQDAISRRPGATSEKIKHHRAEDLEAQVWETISGLLKEPERLRAGLDAMIERERAAAHGDPEAETRLWLNRLAEVDRKRSRFQTMAAEDLISFDAVRARMADLEETRRTADRQLRDLLGRQEQLRQLEEDRDALLEDYARLVPEALASWTPRSASTSTGCSGWRPRLHRTGRSKSAGML